MTSPTTRSATSAISQFDRSDSGEHRATESPAAPRGSRIVAAVAGVVLSTFLIGSVALAFDNVNAVLAIAEA